MAGEPHVLCFRTAGGVQQEVVARVFFCVKVNVNGKYPAVCLLSCCQVYIMVRASVLWFFGVSRVATCTTCVVHSPKTNSASIATRRCSVVELEPNNSLAAHALLQLPQSPLTLKPTSFWAPTLFSCNPSADAVPPGLPPCPSQDFRGEHMYRPKPDNVCG